MHSETIGATLSVGRKLKQEIPVRRGWLMSGPYEGDSNAVGTAGLAGTNSTRGDAVFAKSAGGFGVHAVSAHTTGIDLIAPRVGVYGEFGGPPSRDWQQTVSDGGGVVGVTNSDKAIGVVGISDTWEGVHGLSHGAAAGVAGFNDAPSNGQGVWGECQNGDGVVGTSHSAQHAGVSANNTAGGYGLWARATTAGYFDGDVQVTGDVILINRGQDCAEDFDIEDGMEKAEPGTVLIIGASGKLAVSDREYDPRVAGVVSGAGDFHPAIVLNRVDSEQQRLPIALIGKTFCKVDAALSPIRPGDLLTSASTPGHAMKVLDRANAVGTILGKALASLERGCGLIPFL
jgi:hypothetical protein